jgi:hypothetical protein
VVSYLLLYAGEMRAICFHFRLGFEIGRSNFDRGRETLAVAAHLSEDSQFGVLLFRRDGGLDKCPVREGNN